MQKYRTSPTATPEMSRSAHRSMALAWIAFPSVNPRSSFSRGQVWPESPQVPVCRLDYPHAKAESPFSLGFTGFL